MRKRSSVSKIRRMVLMRCIAILTTAVITASVFTNVWIPKAASLSLVVLSRYSCTLKIGQSFYLIGVASNGKTVTWKSSSSKIASVNTYGQVTAKKAGTCKITGKVSGGEASCTVTVEKTTITLSSTSLTMENGATATLKGSASSGNAISWRSQKSSVASVDDNGKITANKPGETTITATADGSSKTCKVTVKNPKITLNHTSGTLYRGQTLALTAKTSSGKKVVWRSRKTSVATVSDSGVVTAVKHGSTRITATLDGTTKECEITVKQPEIKLNKTSLSLKKGASYTLKATVSSGQTPTWKSSKSSVATVNSNGKVTAVKKGTCTIYATEDGAKAACLVQTGS